MQQNRCQCGYNNMNVQPVSDMKMKQSVNYQCAYKEMPQSRSTDGCQCALKEYNSDIKDGIDWGGYPIAMAYVPWQKWKCVYDAEEGINSGTIFPELELPFYGESYACKMGGMKHECK